MSNPSDTVVHHDPAIITIRKLAALDIAFHGPKLILAEFAFGVVVPAALGVVSAYAGFFGAHFNLWYSLLGCCLLCIGLNYVPLLLYAISIARRKSAQEEVAFELAHKERYARKYSVQSLLLLLPLVIPVLAIYQERQKQGHQ
jgi:hypothetical protein